MLAMSHNFSRYRVFFPSATSHKTSLWKPLAVMVTFETRKSWIEEIIYFVCTSQQTFNQNT